MSEEDLASDNCDPVSEDVRRMLASIARIYAELESNADERCLFCRLRADAGAFMGMAEIIARNPKVLQGEPPEGDAANKYITLTVS